MTEMTGKILIDPREPLMQDDRDGLDPDANVVTDSFEQRINLVRWIVDNWQYRVIDGRTVDGTTASVIVQVIDNLNEGALKTLEEKFGDDIASIAGICWDVYSRASAKQGGK